MRCICSFVSEEEPYKKQNRDGRKQRIDE
jgi:hypothetical protein